MGKDKVKLGEQLFQKGYSMLEDEPKDSLSTSGDFIPFLNKAAKYKNPKAIFMLGYILCVGYKDLPMNISKGKKALKKCYESLVTLSAEKHDYQAAKFLSEYYRVPLADYVKDDDKVKKILALSDSYREAQLSLEGNNQDEIKEELSKPDTVTSTGEGSTVYDQLILAIQSLNDDGSYDNQEKLTLIKGAADKGNMRAAVFLGDAYKEGKYVPVDADTSRLYYEKAEKLGSIKAKFILGKEAVEGQYANQDIVKGLNRIYQSAKAGYPEAQFYLGNIYYEGKFLSQDIHKAYLYFQAAYSRGYEEAKPYLKKIEQRESDAILGA